MAKKVILDIPIYFEPYFPNVEEVAFDVGRQLKVISVRNKIFKWNDVSGSKEELIAKFLEGNKLAQLIEEIKEAAKEDPEIVVPAEILSYKESNKVKRVKLSDEEVSKIDKATHNSKSLSIVSIVSEPTDVLEDLDLDEPDKG